MTGKEFKKRLFEKSISQGKLARLLDVDKATVSRWALNQRPISYAMEIAIKTVLRKI